MQRDERGAVRVVLETLDRRFHVPLAALEIDDAIRALVTAAVTERGDAAGIVAAAGLGEPFGQRLHRLAFVQLGAIDDHELAATRRGRTECVSTPWS